MIQILIHRNSGLCGCVVRKKERENERTKARGGEMPSFVVFTPLALFGKRIYYTFLHLVPLHTSEDSHPRLVIC